MLAWLTLAALLVIDPSASRTDVSGGVSTEVRGGWAPVDPVSPSTAAFVVVLIPNVDLQHTHRRRGTVGLGYAPRMFLRQPNQLSVRRPLLFHDIDLSYARRLNRAWQFGTTARAGIGEIDYTSAALAFDVGQTQLPNNSVLSLLTVDGSVGFTGTLSPHAGLGIATGAGTRRSLPNGDEPPSAVTRNYADVTVGPSLELGARDDLSVRVVTSVIDFVPGALFVSVDARLAWSHALRRRLRLGVDAGMFVGRVALRQDDTTGADDAAFPVGSLSLTGTMIARSRYSLGGAVTASAFGVFDAGSGRLLYRSLLGTDLVLALPPRWSAGITASFVTAITPEPADSRDVVSVAETIALARTPIAYRIDDTKSVEFGTILGVRAPHLAAQDFSSTQYEAWLYVAFRIGGTTARAGRQGR